MSRRFAFLLSLALVMAVALTGCGMNKEKAIEQMGQALTDSSVIESGRLTGEISGTISLGADSIPMELTMEGAFKDQMQTMAMKMSGEVMGNPLDTETYQLDGKTYTLDPTTGGYIESPSATAGMDYQQLMTLGQAEMVQLYIDGATAAEDFAFTEEENGLRVSFTMPTEQLGQMQQQISSLMTDELLPALEEQMRQSVSEQMDALLESMGGAEALQVDQAQLNALIDQQVQMVMEMERQLFESLQINGLSCDMLITDGVINDQTVGMQMEFALRDLVDSLAGSLGVTGTRREIKTDLSSIIKVVRENTDIPCAIGFGISTPEQTKKMADISDGVIVGSALIKLLEKHGQDAPPYIGEYVKSMKQAL